MIVNCRVVRGRECPLTVRRSSWWQICYSWEPSGHPLLLRVAAHLARLSFWRPQLSSRPNPPFLSYSLRLETIFCPRLLRDERFLLPPFSPRLRLSNLMSASWTAFDMTGLCLSEDASTIQGQQTLALPAAFFEFSPLATDLPMFVDESIEMRSSLVEFVDL